jgi:ribonuclease R
MPRPTADDGGTPGALTPVSRKPARPAPLPSRAELLRFIHETPGKVGKREIARAFQLRGADRPALKGLLKELVEEGLLERGRRQQVRPAGALPPVAVLEVTLIDDDGQLRARPVDWGEGTPPPRILVAQGRDPGPALAEGDRVLARLQRNPEGSYLARVIRRLPKLPGRVIGVLEQVAGSWRLMPTDRKQKFDFVIQPGNRGRAERGELIAAEIVAGQRLGLREARVVERLGRFSDPRAFSLIAIHERGIPTEFSAEALAEAAAARPVGPEVRTDMRALPFVTIDGADARDFDDAVFAEPDTEPANAKGWRIVVAIADVAHYVRPGSALDRAARERGNSTYFPDRVVPMLPEALSNDLCSLRPDEDRAALTVTMSFDADGRKRWHRFERALIRSCARLTYEAVQAACDGRPDRLPTAAAAPLIAPLYGAWEALMRARGKREPLDLDLPELEIVLGESGHVDRVRPRPRYDSHRLIEEFMIAANVAAAEELEHLRQACMYRIHDSPDPEKLRSLRDFLATLGLSFSLGEVARPRLFNRVLDRVRGTPHWEVVNTAILRSQAQAVYAPDNIGHFGLALRRYAHFTSPIRRFADLLVHRALIRGLGLGADGLADADVETMAAIGAHISMTERRSMAAEQGAADRYLAAYMADRLGAEFAGTIAGVIRAGLFVRLNETGADGLVPISSLGSEFFIHDEAAQALVGERTGRRHRLGDRVQVRLVEADTVTGSLNFRLTDWEEHEHAQPAPRRRGPAPGQRSHGRRGER